MSELILYKFGCPYCRRSFETFQALQIHKGKSHEKERAKEKDAIYEGLRREKSAFRRSNFNASAARVKAKTEILGRTLVRFPHFARFGFG